jgi:hypothetical protein
MCATFIFMSFLPLSFSCAISLPNVFVYLSFIHCYFLLPFQERRASFFNFWRRTSPYISRFILLSQEEMSFVATISVYKRFEREKKVCPCDMQLSKERARESGHISYYTQQKEKTTEAYIRSYCPKLYRWKHDTCSYIDIWGPYFTFHMNSTFNYFLYFIDRWGFSIWRIKTKNVRKYLYRICRKWKINVRKNSKL